MKNLLFLLKCVVPALLFLSCRGDSNQKTPKIVDKEAAIAEIDRKRDLYMSSVKTRDMSALKGAVSPDIISMYPDSEAWRKMKEEFPRSPSYDSLHIHPLEIEIINEEWAFELGYSDAWYTPKGSDSVITIHDTYMAILRNTGNGWQLYREVASGQMPPDEWITKADKLKRQ